MRIWSSNDVNTEDFAISEDSSVDEPEYIVKINNRFSEDPKLFILDDTYKHQLFEACKNQNVIISSNIQ